MITGHTRTYALLGDPVEASPSPRVHGAWFAEHGIDAVYVALRTPSSDGLALAFRTLGLAGANVTVPHKGAVAAQVDRLEPEAMAAGAVNTLFWDEGRLVGANTDGEGLLASLAASGVAVAGRRVALVGAGGAAAGIAPALVRARVEQLVVVNRTPGRARDLAARLDSSRVAWAGLDRSLAGVELVVHCTTTRADTTDAPHATHIDIRTATATGRAMLCYQAAFAFERWTGIRPDAQAALARLQNEASQ